MKKNITLKQSSDNKMIVLSLTIISLIMFVFSPAKVTVTEKTQIRSSASIGAPLASSSLPVFSTRVASGKATVADVILTAREERLIRIAGVDLTVPAGIEVSLVSCNADLFRLPIQAKFSEGKVFLSCSQTGGEAPLVLKPDQPVKLGSFAMNPTADFSAAKAELQFTRVNIPDADINQSVNLGENAVEVSLLFEE